MQHLPVADHIVWGSLESTKSGKSPSSYDLREVTSQQLPSERDLQRLRLLNIDPASIRFMEDESRRPEVPTKLKDIVEKDDETKEEEWTCESRGDGGESCRSAASSSLEPAWTIERRESFGSAASSDRCEPQGHNTGKLDQQQSDSKDKEKDNSGTDRDVATTLMIRNLPYSLTREELEQAVDESGFADMYNFVYLPHKWNKQLGFAFINFVDVVAAKNFHAGWHKSQRFKSKCPKGIKPLNVSAASVQGHTAHELQTYLQKIEIGSKISLGGHSRQPVVAT